MRTKLKQLGDDKRYTFIATFERYGEKHSFGHSKETILLKDVKLIDTEDVLTDHIWLTVGKQLYELGNLVNGDIVQFNARVAPYWKKNFYCPEEFGYRDNFDYELDYRLDRANKFSVLNRTIKHRKAKAVNKLEEITVVTPAESCNKDEITSAQAGYIKAMEEHTNVKFTGTTKTEASKYISANKSLFRTMRGAHQRIDSVKTELNIEYNGNFYNLKEINEFYALYEKDVRRARAIKQRAKEIEELTGIAFIGNSIEEVQAYIAAYKSEASKIKRNNRVN